MSCNAWWRSKRTLALKRPAASELVAPLDPVLPVLDRLARLLVGVQSGQLGEGDRQRAPLPGGQDEHLVLADLLGRHPDDLDLIADLERRRGALGDAPGEKRKLQ